jgi:hypothetical protein
MGIHDEVPNRAGLIKEAFRIIHDDVASVVLWNNGTVYAMQSNIAFTLTVKAAHALVMLKDVRPTQ